MNNIIPKRDRKIIALLDAASADMFSESDIPGAGRKFVFVVSVDDNGSPSHFVTHYDTEDSRPTHNYAYSCLYYDGAAHWERYIHGAYRRVFYDEVEYDAYRAGKDSAT